MAFVYWIRHINPAKHNDIAKHGYVGITSRTVEKRFKQHVLDANNGSPYPIHAAIRKYDKEMVVETIVEGSLEYCQLIEKRLRPKAGIGYNCAIGGAATTLGAVYSEETRRKIAKAAKGRKASDEARRKMSESQKKRPPASEVTRQKLSEASKGRRVLDSAREKISKANKGRKLSESTINKIREKSTGRVKTQEAKDKQSEAMKGRNLWENSAARKDIWASAAEFYTLVLELPKSSAKVLSLKLGFADSNPWKLVDKLRSGWRPREDAAYLEWLEQYNKECNESTLAT